jgi:hypothetical protein
MRLHDWPELLAEFIASRRETPFAYGTHDCCQFAALAVEAITGTNPASAWVYTNQAQAEALIADAGGLEQLVTDVMGEPVHPSRAGRGDVVLANLENGPTVGVCLGRECAFVTDVGLTYRPREFIATAWSA